MVCIFLSAALFAANVPGSLDLHLRPAPQITGLTAAEVVQANAAANRIVEVLRAASAVGRPPAGQCVRMFSYVVPSAAPVLTASVTVALPTALRGQCAHVVDGGLTVRVNDFAAWRQAPVHGPAGVTLGDARGPFYLNPSCEKPGCVAFMRPGVPVLVPVTKEEHLAALERGWAQVIEKAECFRDDESASSGTTESARRTLDEAKASLAVVQREARSLSMVTRKAPACWLSGKSALQSSGAGGCLPEQRIMRINPRYFDGMRKTAIQLITVESTTEALRLLPSIDLGALRSLVH